MSKCSFCDETIYIKVIQYAAPMLAPLTPEQELRDRLTNMTGEVYARLESNFCPMCGKSRKENSHLMDRPTALAVLKDLSNKMHPCCDLFGRDILAIDRPDFEVIRKKYLDQHKEESDA